jgi:transglutaminase-like putative cysteine protease
MTGARDTKMVLAAAGATLAASLGLHPLIDGWAWYVGVMLVVGMVGASGVAVRRFTRSPVVVVLVQGLAVVVLLTWLFVRDSALLGVLPGLDALQGLRTLSREGADVAAGQAPPVDAAAGVLLMAAAGIGLIAILVDLVTVTLAKPAVAGLALLAVYCVPVSILGDGTSWAWFILAALAYLGLLAVEGQERISAWGRSLSGARSGTPPALLTSGTGARQATAIAVTLAVLVPALLPTFTRGLAGYGSFGNGDGDGPKVNILNPILDIRRNLTEQSDDVALTYRTSVSRPGPLRVVADEVFDGTLWSPSTDRIPTENRVQDGLTDPPGLTPEIARTVDQTMISIGPLLNQTYLPLPYPATGVSIRGSWIYNSSTLDVLGQNERTAGLSYDVTHLTVSPTAEQLQSAPSPDREFVAATTELPEVPELVRSEARRIAGTGSTYEQAVRLQRYFRTVGGFTYSVEAPLGEGADDGSLDVMEAFLTVKRGYCVHFASAMAVMARSLGIPARVAVGFLPGRQATEGTPGTWVVTFREAHAWPELYFQGVGWVRFEPTPAVQTGTPPTWSLGTDGEESPTPTSTSTVMSSASASIRPDDESDDSASSPTGLAAVLDAVPWRGVLVLAVLAMLALLPHLVAAVRRAWRWRSARTRSDRAEAAWDVLRSRCADLGVTWPSSLTPRGVRDRLVASHELAAPARDALARLVADLETARYAPDLGSGDARSPEELREDVRRVAAGIASVVPTADRRRARWLPATAWDGVETLDRVEDVRERIS